jgi:hypothetical protein
MYQMKKQLETERTLSEQQKQALSTAQTDVRLLSQDLTASRAEVASLTEKQTKTIKLLEDHKTENQTLKQAYDAKVVSMTAELSSLKEQLLNA